MIVTYPKQVRVDNNLFVMRDAQKDGANAFKANSFVFLDNGSLKEVPKDGILCYGFTPSASRANTAIPPETLPFPAKSEMHNPFDVRGAIFEINISDDSGTVGTGGPVLSEAIIGSDFGICISSTGFHCVNVDETSSTFFKVIGWVEGQEGTEINGRVRAQVIESKIQ